MGKFYLDSIPFSRCCSRESKPQGGELMRKKDAPKTNELFTERWSPRAFEESPLEQAEIDALFEAARWSPSCYNDQPWYFVYATEGEPLKRLQSVLVDSNQVWAKKAPMLVMVFARRNFAHNQKENKWSEFDVGASTMALIFQAHFMGLSCHPMAGFSPEKAYEVCGVDPKTHKAMCALVVGKQGDRKTLPSDIQEREFPNDRHPTGEFVQKLS